MRFDDGLTDGQPQPETVGLGGEKGMQQLIVYVWRQAWPGILYRDFDSRRFGAG